MRAITNSGQLQNNCQLFVWQNQDNFMQSVINSRIISELFFQNSGPELIMNEDNGRQEY